MEKLGFDLDDGSSPADAKQTNPQVIYGLPLLYSIMKQKMFIHCFFFIFTGSSEIIDTKMHSVIGAWLPVQRC